MGLRVCSATKIGHQLSYNFKMHRDYRNKSIFKEFTARGLIVIGDTLAIILLYD